MGVLIIEFARNSYQIPLPRHSDTPQHHTLPVPYQFTFTSPRYPHNLKLNLQDHKSQYFYPRSSTHPPGNIPSLRTLREISPLYGSSHHSFSFLICSSSSGVKSFLILKVFRISSAFLPLIMLATVLQVTSSSPFMSR